MGHSYIVGEGLEFQVRDAVCEFILESLSLIDNWHSASARTMVVGWHDSWSNFPPGCKELEVCLMSRVDREEVCLKLKQDVIPSLIKGSEAEDTAWKMLKLIESCG
ncbi:hypothetical protein SAMN02745181_2557 [Rubritalea squalenifaciens DSM 18772]|uniref:Uncharacterized protein n=1 Tax=Rubritalea squalenifaciens DSM 18772 TaxID=1123071 RepID=A0A1M6M085_9BACT|nr:hypothetical protein SAMN02745181_2557 [Rubritalea squalenifaciens DSM 18772]